jgi:tRNA 2-thiouridine synthesizing protein A
VTAAALSPQAGGDRPFPDEAIRKENQRMTADELQALEIGKTIDARGTACPGPLLEAKKGIGAVKVGEVVEIKSNDQGSRNDIPAWTHKVGHEFLGCLEDDGHDRLFVRRRK